MNDGEEELLKPKFAYNVLVVGPLLGIRIPH